jgi:glutathione S-transferase
MKLYMHPASPNCVAVLMTAALLEIPLEIESVDLFKGTHLEPDFLAINPNGFVPVLQEDDFLLWETNAITQYLASKRPNCSLWPANDRSRADIARWQF